jgi:hypothetical protein
MDIARFILDDKSDRTHDGSLALFAIGRIDISAAIEEEFNAWYNTVYIPGFLTITACIRARRFVCVEGQPKYLTVYDFDNPTVSEGEDWRKGQQ